MRNRTRVRGAGAALLLIMMAITPAGASPTEPRRGKNGSFDPEAKLAALGIQLPPPSAPMANYVKAVRTGNLVFLAGHGPVKANGDLITGKVGKELTLEQGYDAARLTAINLMGSLKTEIGTLAKVKRIVKLFGLVNTVDGFADHPKVINGASDLLVEVFGERGRHARAAVGATSLPLNIAVEIEMVVEVEPE